MTDHDNQVYLELLRLLFKLKVPGSGESFFKYWDEMTVKSFVYTDTASS